MKILLLVALASAFGGCLSETSQGNMEPSEFDTKGQSKLEPSKISWLAEGEETIQFTIIDGRPQIEFVFVQDSGAIVSAFIASGSCSGLVSGPQATEVGQLRSRVECTADTFPQDIRIQVLGAATGFVEISSDYSISIPS